MVELWHELGRSVRALLDAHPLVLLVVVMFAEELGIPSPIPSDVLMLLAGVRARQGDVSLPIVLLIQELATLGGTVGLYLFSRHYGRGFVARYGWLLHLGPATIERAEVAMRHSGWRAVFFGRLIPGLRIATPLAAGIFGMPFRAFLPAVAAGAFLYILVFTLAGYFIGPIATAWFERVALPGGALVSLAIVILGATLVRSVRRETTVFVRGGHGQPMAARLDGLLAGLAALLATNGIVGLLGFVLRLVGYPTAMGGEEVGTGLRLLLGGPFFLLLASLLGAFDEWIGMERFAPVPRLLLTAGLPLAVILAIAIPLAETGLIPLATEGGGALIGIEILRWIIYGLALGQLLPLDAAVHESPAH